MLDVVIVLIILFYAYEGYVFGFVRALVDLLSFIASFILALKFYTVVGSFLFSIFTIPIGFANAAGFFIVALVSEVALSLLFRRLVRYLPHPLPGSQNAKVMTTLNRYAGVIPGVLSAFIILSFIFSIILAFPSSPFLKNLITGSRAGAYLVKNTATFERAINSVFGDALHESLTFLTIKPESTETVDLRFTVTDGRVDAQAEQAMFRLVNQERAKAGVHPLIFDDKLRDVGRYYSEDMFKRGYFSHTDPEGRDPFDRMEEFGISFLNAGENLALAPSVELAMQGLMNSPGHRENILSEKFGKIGIGVIDGGIYGKMFTQQFTD
jgi:uncharacterized protein YkwD/uncharacterized membrane protein required for colicin V production